MPSKNPASTSPSTSPRPTEAAAAPAMMALSLDPLEFLPWIRARIDLGGFSDASWSEEHDTLVTSFLQHPNQQHVFFRVSAADGTLAVEHIPQVGDAEVILEFMYFLKDTQGGLKYGKVNGRSVESLLRTMDSVYVHQYRAISSWPESVRKDFREQFHRFMSTLTEIASQANGKTILYTPKENLDIPDAAALDKDLVQRLETVVIRWTRQIKEVVNNQDMAQQNENTVPLEEVQFWRSRTQDLKGITDQLKCAGVQRIVRVPRGRQVVLPWPLQDALRHDPEGFRRSKR